MNEEFQKKEVNNLTMEVISKGIYKETAEFGFSTQDYIKLVNALLELTIHNKTNGKNNTDEIVEPKLKELKLPLVGEHVQVRLFDKQKDITTLEKWLSDEKGRMFLLSRLTSKQTDLMQLIEDESNKLGIITSHDSSPIGVLAFLNYDKPHNKAELRKLIGEEGFRGRGYAKEATKLWIQYGINNLKLRKIYLHTIDTNIANIRLNKDLGFKIEGILRKECLIDGFYHDVLRMAYLAF